MSDIAQQNLKEPAQVDWEGYGKSGWVAPPIPVNPDGTARIFYGVATGELDDPDTLTGEPLLQYKFDPIKIVKSGQDADGYEVRFTRASVRPYTYLKDGVRVPKKGNPNALADYLRAVGLQAKPQTNSEYQASVKAASNKLFGFIADWEAYGKEANERIKGYNAFPVDPKNPGQRSAILHAGDVVQVLDNKGNPTGETQVIKSEVLFANLKLRYFRDAAPRR